MFLYKRKDSQSWYVGGITKNGRKTAKALHKFLGLSFPVIDKRTAELLLANLRMKEVRQELGVEQLDSIPVDKFYLDYLRFCDRNKTYNTVRADSYRFKKWLRFLEVKGIKSIAGISKKILNEFVRTELKTKKNNTINKYTSVIRASLQWGVRQGCLKENPVKDMPRLSVIRPFRSASFKDGDLEKLFSIDDKLFIVYLKVIYYTLVRRSEALSLTWDDIDFKRKKIVIRQTKNKTSRMVPIARKLLKVLKGLSKNGDLLFPGWQQHSVTTKFRRLKKKLKLRIDGIHHFRHLGASKLLEKGVNPKVVQELLGHKTITTTMQIYAHVSQRGIKEAVNKL